MWYHSLCFIMDTFLIDSINILYIFKYDRHSEPNTYLFFGVFFVTPLILSSVVITLPYTLHTIFNSLLKLQHRLRRENKQARLEGIRAMSLHYAVAQLSSTISPEVYQVLMEGKNPNYISWETS